jgi:hypothetical protein
VEPGNAAYNLFMRKFRNAAFVLLACWLFVAVPVEAQGADQECVDEICDGLDNDCDKSVDDNVDCGANLECGCGNCNKAMVNGSCAEGVPWKGFCLVDHCPAGTKCNQPTGKCRRI